MYIPEELKNYKYIVEAHDNYVVLSNKSFIDADYSQPVTIKVLNKYIYPSDFYFYTYNTYYSSRDFVPLENTTSNYMNTIEFVLSAILCYIAIKGLVWGLNIVTSCVRRGGIFHA